MPKYHEEDDDPIQKELEDLQRTQSGKYVNWKDIPKIRIRILRKLGKKNRTFWRTVWIHYGAGPGGRPIVCLHKQVNKKCYPCEQIVKLMKGESRDQQLAQQMRVTRTYMMNVVMFDPKGVVDDRVKILRLSPTCMMEVLKYHSEPEYGDVSHPKTGYMITIERIKKGKSVRYSVTPGRKASPVDPDWLDNLHDLDSEVEREVITYDDQKKMFLGESSEEENSDYSSKLKKAKAKKREEDESDDMDLDDDGDDDDE